MLINGQRALAYITKVTGISPMDAERLESVDILGWHVVCGKGEFKVGDLGVFIEVDSLCPDEAPFNEMAFLVSKHLKVKTQKIRGVYSQGLFMPLSAFGDKLAGVQEGDDVTEKLGITYLVASDNKRKGKNTVDPMKRIQARHAWTRKAPKWLYGLIKWLYRKDIKRAEWPAWVVKTDEERVQNLHYDRLRDEDWVATEKIDGTSATYTVKRDGRHKFTRLACSRNVVFDKPDKKCYYDTNVYTLIDEEYHILDDLEFYLETHPNVDWITIQGEIYGDGIQKRDYSMKDGQFEFRVFNLINSVDGRLDSVLMQRVVPAINPDLKCVPVLDTNYALPATCDELLAAATGESVIDGLPREGIVFRSKDGKRSFKAVSNEFLVKYHGKD